MEDSNAPARLEKRISDFSKGGVGHEAEAEPAKDLTLVKLYRGLVLCYFIVHYGVSDGSGKWHEGAMTTLMDIIGSWTAFSLTSFPQVTVYLSVSFYSKPNLQEVVEVEGKTMGEKGRITSVRVAVRKKDDGLMVALGVMWMAPSHSNNKNNQINKPLPSKL